MPSHERTPEEIVTMGYCTAKHRYVNWVVTATFALVSLVLVIIGIDYAASSRASDAASEVKAELRVQQAHIDEKDKAKIEKLDDIQAQINRRFESTDKKIDKLADKIDRMTPQRP